MKGKNRCHLQATVLWLEIANKGGKLSKREGFLFSKQRLTHFFDQIGQTLQLSFLNGTTGLLLDKAMPRVCLLFKNCASRHQIQTFWFCLRQTPFYTTPDPAW